MEKEVKAVARGGRREVEVVVVVRKEKGGKKNTSLWREKTPPNKVQRKLS